MRCGELELELIHAGTVAVDAGGPFGLVPRALYGRTVEPDADNNVPMVLTCLLVRSRGKTILIDTGLGDKLTSAEAQRWHLETNGGLVAALARHGVEPGDVDIVLNTHLHSDHCGGNTCLEGDRLEAAFPRAEYWVQRIEWADASHPDARTSGTYLPVNFAPLVAQGRMRLLHGDTAVTDEVRCVVTPGHTRGHQSVVLESRGWRGLYVADMATFAVHMQRLSWLTAYDVLPLENVATKARWQRWALETGAWLIFEHDPNVPVARLVRREGRIELDPVRESLPLTEDSPTPQRLPG